MKNFIILFILISFFLKTNAQTDSVYPLKVGDKIPDHTFTLLNYRTKIATLESLKGKPVILDFWATWCSICIAGFPKMHELQKQFGDKVQIVLVNRDEDRAKINRFIDKRKKMEGKQITLPIIYGDSLLSKVYLNVKAVPMFYWINKEGIIEYINSKSDVTAENIQKFIDSMPLAKGDLPMPPLFPAIEDGLKYKFSKPDSTLMWQSSLQKVNSLGFSPGLLKSRDGFSGLVCLSGSMSDLYRFAFGDFIKSSVKPEYDYIKEIAVPYIILESSSLKNIGMHNGNYNDSKVRYNYQLIAPPFSTADEMQQWMRDELERSFNVKAVKEKREIEYLSLTCSDSTKISTSKNDKKIYLGDTNFKISGMTFSKAINLIEIGITRGLIFLPEYPLVNETGIKGNVDFEIDNTDMKNVKEVDKALSRFNLHLTLKKKMIEVLVIKDANQAN